MEKTETPLVEPKYIIEYAKPSKRLLSFFADAVMFSILGILLFTVACCPIISSMDSYKTADEGQKYYANEIYQMYEDSHLVEKTSEGTYSQEPVVEKYLENKYIDKDYDDNGDYLDNFLYFYITYASNNLTIDGEPYSVEVATINRDILGYDPTAETPLWVLVDDDISLPMHLTEEAKIQIKKYRDGEVTAESEKYNSAFETVLNTVYQDAGNNVIAVSDQYLDYLDNYQKNALSLLFHYSISAMILYVAIFPLYFVLIPLLLKKGRTLGKFFLHYSLYSSDKNDVPTKNVVLRSVLQFVCYFFLVGAFPVVQVGLSSISLPFIATGDSAITMIIPIMICLFICMISFLMMNSSLEYQSLVDKVTHVVVGKNDPKLISEEVKEEENKEVSDEPRA